MLANRLAGVGRRADAAFDQYGFQLRNIHAGRQFIVTQMDIRHCSVLHNQLFGQCVADPLDRPTFNLSLVGERIEDGADIVCGCELLERHLAGCRVNRDFGYLGAE